MTIANFIDRVSDLLAAGILASFGGAAQAVYQIYKGEKAFSVFSFSVCVILSFFVGQVVGSLIPESLSKYHDGLLLMAGFSVFPILEVFNVYAARFVKTLLYRVYPVIDEPAPKTVDEAKESNNDQLR